MASTASPSCDDCGARTFALLVDARRRRGVRRPASAWANDRVEDATKEEFRKHAKSVEELRADPTYRSASPEELAEVERILDVQSGVFSGAEFFRQAASCSDCGRHPGFKDVVNTPMMDAKHSNSAVLHTVVGNKHGEEGS